jgi:hypothetical protein
MDENFVSDYNNDSYRWIPMNSTPPEVVHPVVTFPIQQEVGEVRAHQGEVVATVPLQVSVPTENTTAGSTSDDDFNYLAWDTCDFNEEGTPIGYLGKLWINYPVLKLRVICKKLMVYGIKNAKKDHIVESIVKTHQNSKAYAIVRNSMEDIDNNQQQGTTRKEQQCAYRLMNILFSDDFADEFACIGNTASRKTLDIGKAANEKLFWEKVEDAYLVSKADYHELQFREDEIFTTETIYPGKIVPHDWKKLRSIWKAVNTDYKAACTRFTQSGTHDCNFYSYCQGKKEPYYLRLHLVDRPELNEMVEADLPEACSLSSSSGVSSKDDNISVSTSNRKRA